MSKMGGETDVDDEWPTSTALLRCLVHADSIIANQLKPLNIPVMHRMNVILWCVATFLS